jgi:hypothetical protein
MEPLPPFLAVRYRIATSHEIRSWSFGLVRSRRPADATAWQDQRGTLDDQGIFGPLQEYHCACGKYEGERYRGMICDRCGVKLASPSVRRERFGHIELGAELQHPLGKENNQIAAFPVIPAVFLASSAGDRLAQCYETLAEAASAEPAQQGMLDPVIEVLLPVVRIAHEWRLGEASRLARGLALELREGPV